MKMSEAAVGAEVGRPVRHMRRARATRSELRVLDGD